MRDGEMRLITQKGMETKYNEDHTTISLALKAGDVRPVKESDDRYRCFLYDEEQALKALVALYARRSEGLREKASRWDEQARKAMSVFLAG